ncbi:PilZ domain-containing protein [Alkalimonas collagenimarina]|uniref:PilZ domain-containing protein n=1 Tax=Alkalimonas collagenimarina TaxID=400390 RepID=A0ABT9H0F6_9GAMM|nr:PilZ domain-containing protein [Alkalimonas collagenimarina]MDP4536792.1 PilZ domain-containing protein [Alkalimonas collagenimarina]
MLNQSDNRHFYRMMVNADVQLFINDPEAGRSVDGICRDLSASGMSVDVNEPLEIGTMIRVKLESANNSVPPLDATAKVMRCGQENNDCYQLGLAFIDMN